jgi:ureidoacrylate peracid hydrolase
MAKPALIVVDMQNGFCKPGGLIYIEQAGQQIPSVALAIDHARAENMQIIYTRVRWDSLGDVVEGLRANLPSLSEHWSDDGGFRPTAWGHRVVDELTPRPDDHCLDKRAFYPSGLAPLLRKLGVDEVFVVGTSANNCVYAACLAAFEAGLVVHAIEDCVSSFSEPFREPWLRNIDAYLGSLATLEWFVGLNAASIRSGSGGDG